MNGSLGRLVYWADDTSPWNDELSDRLVEDFAGVVDLDPSRPVPLQAADTVLLVFSAAKSEAALSWLERLNPDCELNVVAVVDDAYLGTDVERDNARVSGAAVALIRSLAVGRGTIVRANAICMPTSATDTDTELRGPLRLEPTVEDLIEAISFLSGPDGGYVSGQVLYLNGGRQLFSSLTS